MPTGIIIRERWQALLQNENIPRDDCGAIGKPACRRLRVHRLELSSANSETFKGKMKETVITSSSMDKRKGMTFHRDQHLRGSI